MKVIDAIGKSVLIVSDTHIPYSHPDYIKFLKAIKDNYKPDIVTHIGDEVDSHSISFHNSDQELLSAGDELDKAIIEIQDGLHKLFPKMQLLESNHGSLIFRKLKANGIPIRHLKPLHELYETPLWTWYDDFVLKTKRGDVYLCHGKTSPYGKLAKEMGCSAVQGHYHGKAEVTWHRSVMSDRFNMFVGCLVDETSLAMAYGKNNIPKPILASGWIDKNGMPFIIRMNLNDDGKWDGNI